MADVKIRILSEDKTKQGLEKLDLKLLAIQAAALKVTQQFIKFTIESAKFAARVETLAVVTKTLGKNAGLTEVEVRRLERAIQEKGITTEKSRTALARMMQAELDLADATDLARLAQDAAVIAGTNSSEAFERLINVIVTGNVRMARTLGLQVDFNAGYEEMAEQVGKTADELTAQEKAQSRSNSVMKEGKQIAGAYEDAMDTVGKQLQSTARFWDEFKRAFGEGQIESVGKVNTVWQNLLKTETERIDTRHRLADAVAFGILTEEKAAEITTELINKDIEYADVLAMVIDLLDQRTDARELVSHFDKIGIKTKAELTEATLALLSAISAAANATEDLGEKELIVARNEAIIAGNFALAAHYNNLLGPVLAANAALAIQIGLMDAIAARGGLTGLQSGGLGGIVDESIRGQGGGGTVSAFGQTFTDARIVGGKLFVRGELFSNEPVVRQARGGQLANVALVGEQGPELIIDNVVIPANQTRKLLAQGLKPSQGFQGGGPLFGGAFRPGSRRQFTPTKILGATGSGQGSMSLAALSSMLPSSLGGISPMGGGGAATAPIAAAQSAASAAVSVAQSAAQMTSLGISQAIQADELLEAVRELATAEDIEVGMTTAVDLLVS